MRNFAVVAGCLILGAAPAVAQDKATIEKLNDAWTAAFNKGDAAAVAAMYTEDAYVLPPGAEMVKGRTGIEAFWRQAAQQGLTSQIKIAQIAKTGLFASQVSALGSLGFNLASGAYWGPTWPYSSALTGIANKELAAGYTQQSGKQWNQQLGPSLALFDVGVAALKASGNPKNKGAVATAMKTLAVSTPVGHLRWGTGPVPNVVATPIPGGQWVKGSGQFPYEWVFCEHSDDPNVPIQAKLKPYTSS